MYIARGEMEIGNDEGWKARLKLKMEVKEKHPLPPSLRFDLCDTRNLYSVY